MRDHAPVVVTEAEQALQRDYMDQVRALPRRPRSYHVVTYGCQMNAHDSEKLAGLLREMGMTEAPTREEADLVLFNTCCVRDNAERRALGNVTWLKELKRDKPELLIGVCGCMIQQPGMAEKILKQYKFIDLAFGTANLHRLPQLLYEELTTHRRVVEVDQGEDVIAEGLPVKRLRPDHAYITIMYGCDNFCSYCIVPYVRGRERSRDMDAIVREAEELYHGGVKEIMLLGQNVNSYGKGLPGEPTFAQLLRRLDAIGIPRIRFMTSHPKDLSDGLIAAMGECKHVCPQFHLPVQSGSDEILKAMNRHYDRASYLDKVEKLRRAVPGIGLTTDIIVGFPGETEAQFEDTLSLVRQVGYDSAFTFIYSPRPGTKAAKMTDQVPADVAQARLERLLKAQDEIVAEKQAAYQSKKLRLLVDGNAKGSEYPFTARTEGNLLVCVRGDDIKIGEFIEAEIEKTSLRCLFAHKL